MAFVLQSFDQSGVSSNTASPSIFKYGSSTDNIAAINTPGYFEPLRGQVNIGDLIYVMATDDDSFVRFIQITPTIDTEVLSIQIAPGSIDTADLADGSVTTAKLANAAIINGDKMFLEDSRLYVGQPDNRALSFLLSGDVIMNQSGVITIGSGKITDGKIATDAVIQPKIQSANIDAQISVPEDTSSRPCILGCYQLPIPAGVASTTSITAPYALRVIDVVLRIRDGGSSGNTLRVYKNTVVGIDGQFSVTAVAGSQYRSSILIHPNDQLALNDTIDVITVSSGNNFPASDITITVVPL